MILTHLNWIDYSIVGILIISALISFVRGFVREAISLVTWIIAALVALRFTQPLSNLDLLTKYIHSSSLRYIAAFAILFITILIIGALINHLFSQLVEKTGLGGTDRLLGFIFGIGRGALLVGVLVLLGNMASVTQEQWWAQSQLIPKFQPLAKWLQGFVPKGVNNLSQDFIETPVTTTASN